MSPSLTAYVPFGKFCEYNLGDISNNAWLLGELGELPITDGQYILASILACSIPLVAIKIFYHYIILLQIFFRQSKVKFLHATGTILLVM